MNNFLQSMLLVGPGSIGMAFVHGLLNSKKFNPAQINIAHPYISDEKKLAIEKLGIKVNPAPRDYDFVILATKQNIFDKLNDQIEIIKTSKCVYISFAAGLELGYLKKLFGDNVLRAMPNIPMEYCQGFTSLYQEALDSEMLTKVESLFNAIGKTTWCKNENEFDKLMALASCSPAFIFKATEALEKSAIKLGIDKDLAKIIAKQTLIGAGETVKNKKEMSIDQLIKSVASKGGATEAGVEKMKYSITKSINSAVLAAYQRFKN